MRTPFSITSAHTITKSDFRDMQIGYREAVLELFDEVDEDGNSIDVGNPDLSPEAEDYIYKVCGKFAELIAGNSALKNVEDYNWHQVGIDLYLTQNGHGTGFWDRPDIYGGDCDILDKIVEKNFRENYSYYDEATDTIGIE